MDCCLKSLRTPLHERKLLHKKIYNLKQLTIEDIKHIKKQYRKKQFGITRQCFSEESQKPKSASHQETYRPSETLCINTIAY